MRIFRWLAPLLVLAGLALGARAGCATVLFAGKEDVDFTCAGTSANCSFATTAGAYRSNWARGGYGTPSSTVDPPIYLIDTPTFSAASTLWIHAQVCGYYNSTCQTTTSASNQLIRVIDSAGNPAIVIRGTGTAQQLNIASRTSGGTFTTLVTCSSAFNAALTQLDLYVNYGVSGEVTLYNNGTQVCDYTGNVTNGDSATTLNQIQFSGLNNAVNAPTIFSEVIVATTDTRAMGLFTAYTTGNGNSTGFSGTNVCSSIWNAATANSASYGYTATNNTIHNCTVYNTLPAGTYNVLGVVMGAQALVGATGPQHFEFDTRVGGTDYLSSSQSPTNSFSNIGNYIQTTNPNTGVAWVPSDLTGTINFGLEAIP